MHAQAALPGKCHSFREISKIHSICWHPCSKRDMHMDGGIGQVNYKKTCSNLICCARWHIGKLITVSVFLHGGCRSHSSRVMSHNSCNGGQRPSFTPTVIILANFFQSRVAVSLVKVAFHFGQRAKDSLVLNQIIVGQFWVKAFERSNVLVFVCH